MHVNIPSNQFIAPHINHGFGYIKGNFFYALNLQQMTFESFPCQTEQGRNSHYCDKVQGNVQEIIERSVLLAKSEEAINRFVDERSAGLEKLMTENGATINLYRYSTHHGSVELIGALQL